MEIIYFFFALLAINGAWFIAARRRNRHEQVTERTTAALKKWARSTPVRSISQISEEDEMERSRR
jgi:hypothetical protein